MKDYDVTIKMKFKSKVDAEKLKEQITNILCLCDVEIENILDTDDMYYARDFDIIDIRERK